MVPTLAPATTAALGGDVYAQKACRILDAAQFSGTDSDPSTMLITADQARQSSVATFADAGRTLTERANLARAAKGQSDEAGMIAAMVTGANDLATACKIIKTPD